MKKFTSILMSFTLLFSLTFTAFADNTSPSFADVSEKDWFFTSFQVLYDMGAINGTEDGLFHPNDSLTIPQFMKMIFSIIDNGNINANQGTHWGTPYMERAVHWSILDMNEYPESTWDRPITRNEIAEFASLIVTNRLNESKAALTTEAQKLQEIIADWDSIPSRYQPHVVQMYLKGILNGGAKNLFNGSTSLTRAEACVIIHRIISKSNRINFGISF